ncbi:MAG: helix-turn-helix domain-containing protein [Cyanobacteria bacterium P01_A01_bin.3]
MSVQRRSDCPIACALDLLGDRWTLLLIRDMALGKSRFDEFLDSPEGISSNVLSDRLKKLVQMDLATKSPYSSHSRRMTYQLTAKGESLRPILKAIGRWGLRHIPNTVAEQ